MRGRVTSLSLALVGLVVLSVNVVASESRVFSFDYSASVALPEAL